MKWTGLNELREKYLSFFEGKAHLRLPSFSLVPQNDKSLLLINSGMAPMKKYFTGEITPPSKRVTTCQKCIRTPDIERVGKTARHGTYFEMLGNFSFGDYFKNEATAWAWEFCTDVMKLPVDRLWVSIYEEDDQAFDVWTKQVGVSPDRIVRLGKEDNFWEHGSGPCGPCSEFYFDRGEESGCGSPDCAVGCDCDRYVEFWNLVFTQFDSDGNGSYSPLENPNIDTGMGLERLACIMQSVGNLFEVDTVQKIMGRIAGIAGVNYGDGERTDVSLRVITDHIRSTTFMIGDGVMPSNEGRGYVVRRLLRRAARHGRLLGINEPFLHSVCDTVIAENAAAYPELGDKRDLIKKLILVEETAFGKTIDSGLAMLEEMLTKLDGRVLSGQDAFRLYDTYGFPLDLTQDILEERGLSVDDAAFAELMTEQRQRARAARKNAGADAWKGNAAAAEKLTPGEFVGYDTLCVDNAKVVAIICDNELVDSLSAGESGAIVIDRSPFYAESGGQIGDTGLFSSDSVTFVVENTVKSQKGVILHVGTVQDGELRVGGTLSAAVDISRRRAVMRNHTAAHLIQAALRTVLGTHVEQAGQMVDDRHMRFDFTHFSAVTADELNRVESLVNELILDAVAVSSKEMSIDDAKKQGAMALFGEKYGDVVRVVRVGDGDCAFSMELCGGTHVDNTSRLGLLRIVSESSVAAGVRRIEAVTGAGVLEILDNYRGLLNDTAVAIKAGGIDDVARRAVQFAAEYKEVQRELDVLQSKIAAAKADDVFGNMADVDGIKLATSALPDAIAADIRAMCDRLRDTAPADSVVVLAGVDEQVGTISFGCYCGKEAVAKGAHAGNLIREVAKICGGSGGGRPDSAMAGGKDASKVAEALGAVEKLVGAQLSNH